MLEVVFSKDKPSAGTVKVIPMFEDKMVKADFLTDEEAKLVKKAIVQAEFGGQNGKNLDIFGGRAKIILAGLGSDNDDLSLQGAGEKLFGQLSGDERAYIAAEDDNTAIQLAYGILLGSYSFDKYKTEKTAADFPKLEQIIVRVKDPAAATENFKACLALVTAVRYAKDLCNEPASYLTPEVFAADIKRLEYLGLDVEIFDEKALHLKGFGLIEAAAGGTAAKPRVVVVSWRGKRQQEGYDLGLVGKGVCFDSGGISLKPANGMEEMKDDMAGAAVALGTMQALAMRKAKVNVAAVMPLVENMPSGTAQRPGDVVKALSGTTVEVVNTDAEGRLILGDAMWYAQERFKPRVMIDLATLTGAIIVALGSDYAGLFANDDELAEALLKSSKAVGEKLWRMPLDDLFDDQIASDVADIMNVGSKGREAGSIIAATFLKRFVKPGTKWAHLDIAGVTFSKKDKPLSAKGATGYGVQTLNRFIAENYEK